MVHFFQSNNIALIIVLPISIALVGLSIAYIAKADSGLELSSNVIDYTRMNILSAPIRDIGLTDDECPDDYNTILLGFWPGNKRGCPTLFGDVTTDCEHPSISALAPIMLSKWNGYQICIKNSEDYIFTGKGSCKSGYKKCSPDLCVRKSEKCPINQVTVTTSKQTGSGYTSIPMGNNKYLTVKRDASLQTVALIQFSYSEHPCLATNHVDIDSPTYELLKLSWGCGEYGPDQNSNRIDEQSEIDFYKDNGVYKYLNEELTNYMSKIKDNSVYLVERKRMELAGQEQCYNSELPPIPRDSIDSIVSSYFSCMIVVLVFECIIMIGTCCLLGVAIMKSSPVNQLLNVIMIPILTLVTFIIIIIVDLLIKSDTEAVRGTYESYSYLSQLQCFKDSAVNEAFNDYEAYVKDVPDALDSILDWMFRLVIIRTIACCIVFLSFKPRD